MKIRFKSKNLIPKGVSHERKNNIDDSLNITQKGIPIVHCDTSKKVCVQGVEMESEELITRKELSQKIDELVKQYLQYNDPRITIQIGELMYEELKYNTQDNTK